MSITSFVTRRLFLGTVSCILLAISATAQAEPEVAPVISGKQVIGPTAVVEESESDLEFPARVDTGATTSSIHVEESRVEDGAGEMTENVGKTIHFKIKNSQGETEWLRRKIAEISTIKTSERQETRYKVPITLHYKDVKKRVLVSLNDRSHMNYPVLLGRNFLQGDFVVDVDAVDADVEKAEGTVSGAKADGTEKAQDQEPSAKPEQSDED